MVRKKTISDNATIQWMKVRKMKAYVDLKKSKKPIKMHDINIVFKTEIPHKYNFYQVYEK